MAQRINLKQLQFASGAIASLGILVGVYTVFKTDNVKIKFLSLELIGCGLIAGIVGYASSVIGEDLANKQIVNIAESQKEAVDQAKRLKEDNGKLSRSLQNIEAKNEKLVISANELKGVAEQWQEKSQNQVQLAKLYLGEHLKSIQGRLSSAVQTGIRQNNQNTQSSEEHKQHIHKTLTKRLVDLEADIKKWNSWIKDITEKDYLEVCIQILDEIASHKSKIAATSTRLNYHQYVPKGFLRKENALKLNEEYHSVVLEKINEYDEVAANNEEFMSAAGRDIELLKNRLVQQNALVEQLSQPITLPPPNYYKWDASLLNPQEAIATPPNQSTATHANTVKIAESVVVEGVDCVLLPSQDSLTLKTTIKASDIKGCKIFKQSGLLAEKYQNLDFKGYTDLLASLPKKPDGTVHKVQAYETVFNVRKSDSRKLYSSFIDWLEANFK